MTIYNCISESIKIINLMLNINKILFNFYQKIDSLYTFLKCFNI